MVIPIKNLRPVDYRVPQSDFRVRSNVATGASSSGSESKSRINSGLTKISDSDLTKRERRNKAAKKRGNERGSQQLQEVAISGLFLFIFFVSIPNQNGKWPSLASFAFFRLFKYQNINFAAIDSSQDHLMVTGVFFKKWANPGLFFVYFHLSNMTQININ